MVASEGRTQLTVHCLKLRRDEKSAHREAVTDALCHSYEVWFDPKMLVGEELTRTAVATLNLVAYQNGVVRLAYSTQSLHKFLVRHTYAAYALDALYDTGTHIILLNLLLPCFKIVQRQERHVSIVVYRSHNLRVVSRLHCQ